MKQRPRFIKQDQVAVARLQTSGIVCIEKFSDFPQMGRFTLRDEGENDLKVNNYCLLHSIRTSILKLGKLDI